MHRIIRSKISIGVNGLIFAVSVEAGDSPERTIERFEARLKEELQLERLDPTAAILKTPFPEL